MPPRQSAKPIIIDNKEAKDLLEQNKKELSDFFTLKNKKTQMTLSLSVLALIVFGLLSSTLPLNSKLFQNLYPKPASYAVVESNDYLYISPTEKLVVGKPTKIRLYSHLEQPKINAFVARIIYDPSLLKITLAEAVNSTQVTLTSQKIDSQKGTVYLVGNIDQVQLDNNSMPLVQLTVQPLNAGTTNLSLEEPALFSKPDYTNLNSEAQNMTLEIFAK